MSLVPCLRHLAAYGVPSALALSLFALVTACGPAADERELPAFEAPSIVEPVPETPMRADEDADGSWESSSGLEPPVRLFVVEPPEGDSPRAGVLLVHSSWGLNRDVRDFARRIAELGYFVVAPDVYEGVISTTRLTHEELLLGVDRERSIEVLRAGLERLDRALPDEDEHLVVAMRAGAPWAVKLAAEGAPVEAIAIDSGYFEPDLVPDDGLETPVTIFVGALTRSFGANTREPIVDRFEQTGSPLVVEVVDGAGTDLFDPAAMGHSAAAQVIAFEKLKEFLATHAGS